MGRGWVGRARRRPAAAAQSTVVFRTTPACRCMRRTTPARHLPARPPAHPPTHRRAPSPLLRCKSWPESAGGRPGCARAPPPPPPAGPAERAVPHGAQYHDTHTFCCLVVPRDVQYHAAPTCCLMSRSYCSLAVSTSILATCSSRCSLQAITEETAGDECVGTTQGMEGRRRPASSPRAPPAAACARDSGQSACRHSTQEGVVVTARARTRPPTPLFRRLRLLHANNTTTSCANGEGHQGTEGLACCAVP